jgi:hypothetical protein
MKKVIAIVLVVILFLAFTIAGKDGGNANPTNPDTSTPSIEHTGNPDKDGTTATTDPIDDEDDSSKPTTKPTQPVQPTEPQETVPTDPEEPEITLTFKIDDQEYSFGDQLSVMLEHFQLGQLAPKADEIVKPGEVKSFAVVDENGQSIDITVYNAENRINYLKDCSIASVALDSTWTDRFSFNPTSRTLTFDSVENEFVAALGDGYMKEARADHDVFVWLWDRSLDQSIIVIGVAFNQVDGSIRYIQMERNTNLWNY